MVFLSFLMVNTLIVTFLYYYPSSVPVLLLYSKSNILRSSLFAVLLSSSRVLTILLNKSLNSSSFIFSSLSAFKTRKRMKRFYIMKKIALIKKSSINSHSNFIIHKIIHISLVLYFIFSIFFCFKYTTFCHCSQCC